MQTNKIDTDPFTDSTELWQKSLAILAGVREVVEELHAQRAAIQNANPGKMFPPGCGERASLIEALQDVNRSLSADLMRFARSSGLKFPEDLT